MDELHLDSERSRPRGLARRGGRDRAARRSGPRRSRAGALAAAALAGLALTAAARQGADTAGASRSDRASAAQFAAELAREFSAPDEGAAAEGGGGGEGVATPIDFEAWLGFGLELLEGQRSPPAGQRVGDTLARMIVFGEALDAPADVLWFLAYNGAPALFEDFEPGEASELVELVLAHPDLATADADRLRMERARWMLARRRYVEAAGDLDAVRARVAESAPVLEWLATESAPTPELRPALEEAFLWHVARADLDLGMGRLWAAEAPLARAERLAVGTGSVEAQRLALGLRLGFALASQYLEDVEPLVRAAQERGLLEALDPDARADLELRRAIARHELRRRAFPSDRAGADELDALSRDEGLQPALRRLAAKFAAGYYAEAGLLDEARKALARASRADEAPNEAADEQEGGLDDGELDAVALRVAVLAGDAPLVGERLERLERSLEQFLDEWARLAALSPAIALLHFAHRERMFCELIPGSLAVRGPREGARSALRWLYEAQALGGLARGLSIERDPGRFDADLSELIGPQRGLLVFQSGRTESYAFLVDGHELEVVPLAAGWKLRRAASAVANAVNDAVRRGVAPGDAEVAAAVDELAHAVAASRLLPWIESLRELTVVGDDSVGHLPLALLSTATGGRLGDRVALGYAPSMPVAAALARRARARGEVSAGEFDARLVGAPPPPADVRIPAQRLRAWVERLGPRSELAIGVDATVRALAAEGLELLLVVAHGAYDARRECRAGFVLHGESAGAGEIWSSAVEGLPAARVSVLGVCGASQRQVRRGDDGRSGLAASFLLAGSDCVVQTSIDLEIRAATELLESLSVRLAVGDTPAEALRAARAALATTSGPGAPIQSYMVHAWGAAHAPLVDAASVAPNADARQGGFTVLARVAGGLSLVVAALVVAALVGLRRRARARA